MAASVSTRCQRLLIIGAHDHYFKCAAKIYSLVNECKLIAQDGSLIVSEALQAYGNHFISVVTAPEINAAIQSSIRPLLYDY